MEYITALSPLIGALAESQSSALQGVKEPPDSLAPAVAGVSAVDNRLGDPLKTHERWTDLQTKIEKLPKVTGGALAVYQAHVEVSDLALALYSAVRRNAQLSRDPDSDVSNLQEAAAIDMPTTMVRVSRMGDFATLLQGSTGATRQSIAVQFGEEVLAVQDAVNSLTENLQAAVDDTSSPTLSGSLVSTLDSFRRGVESMTRGANPGGIPNAATMSTAQTALQTALSALSAVVLKEMAKLLDDRSSTLGYRRAEALAMGGLAVLLVLGALIWPLARRKPENQPASTPPGLAGRGEADQTWRERAGALR